MRRRLIVMAVLLASIGCGGGGTTTPPDGSASDAGGTVCRSDGECDDGRYCNGVERCDPAGGCVSGPAPCAAGTSCDEAADRCETPGCAVRDADGDGRDSIACGGDDCDDGDADRFPGNDEVCDARDHDEDCDLTTVGVIDVDEDGYVDDRCCNAVPEGDPICGRDCDDDRADVSPVGADDDCDEVDDDCDGAVDEDGGPRSFFRDDDGDGFGAGAALEMCAREVEGYSTDDGDCDDADAAVGPAAVELCNARDDDCDGRLDGPGEDADADGVASRACGGADCYDGDARYGCEPNGWRLLVVAGEATDLDVADVDADGDPDIALALGTSGVRVLVNPGARDRLIEPWVSSDPSLEPGYYYSARIVDLDARGAPTPRELLVGGAGSASYYFERFELGWGEVAIDASYEPHDFALGDVDGDGDTDVVGASSGRGVRLHRAPAWTTTTLVPGEMSFRDEPRRVELADLDGDGSLDLVIGFDLWNPEGGYLSAGDNGGIDVLWGDGTGAFTTVRVATGVDLRGLAIGDLDGDGDSDLAAVGARGDVTWYEQTASRAFTARPLAAGGTSPVLWYAGAAIADLDGDGRGELLAGGTGGSVRVWSGPPSGSPGPSPSTGSLAVWRIRPADVDRDGDADIVVLTGSIEGGAEVWWFENRGGRLASE